MRKTIVLTFVAAALLMAASVALDSYGREIFEDQRSAAGDLPRFTVYDCESVLLESWKKPAVVFRLLAFSLLIAGVRLSRSEPPTASVLGLDTGASRRVVRRASPMQSAVIVNVRADAASLPRVREEDGLTPLERVIRGS